MLKDITLGQFFPGDSVLHRLDPRTKLLLTMGYMILLFSVGPFYGFLLPFGLLLLAILLSRIPVKVLLKGLRPILFLLLVTGFLNLFFIKTGPTLFSFWVVTVTLDGLLFALRMVLRIVLLIMASSLLTYTTSPIALTDAIEHLLSPLARFRVPAHEIATMMSIALRFIPTLIEETDRIISAQKARGADMESGNFLKRAKALVPILIPLFISAFRRADELALAMECRCYNGGEGRTRMRQLSYHKRDLLAALLFGLCAVLVVLINLTAAA